MSKSYTLRIRTDDQEEWEPFQPERKYPYLPQARRAAAEYAVCHGDVGIAVADGEPFESYHCNGPSFHAVRINHSVSKKDKPEVKPSYGLAGVGKTLLSQPVPSCQSEDGRDRSSDQRQHRGVCIEGLKKKLECLKGHETILADSLPHFWKHEDEDPQWEMIAVHGAELIHIAQEMLGRDMGYLKSKDERERDRAIQVLSDLLDKSEEVFNLLK